ncbi:MAG: transcription/translation regulatory transformer protein RfaH [Plesiomonas sp.]|uniref:transcription/translation regulatory transformer protein RfaH n=1 Tax=Plesiomonas sp. TaxID=2486279 RepID=UPI003F3F430A
MNAWYLLYCKRGQQSRAVQHLDMQAIRHFCPVLTVKKLRRGHWREEQEALFPNYLFVHFDPDVFSVTKVHATRGVARVVRFGDDLAKVPDEVVRGLEHSYASFDPSFLDTTAEQTSVTQSAQTAPMQGIEKINVNTPLTNQSNHSSNNNNSADTADSETLWVEGLSAIYLEPDGEKRSLLLVNLLNTRYLQTRKSRR